MNMCRTVTLPKNQWRIYYCNWLSARITNERSLHWVTTFDFLRFYLRQLSCCPKSYAWLIIGKIRSHIFREPSYIKNSLKWNDIICLFILLLYYTQNNKLSTIFRFFPTCCLFILAVLALLFIGDEEFNYHGMFFVGCTTLNQKVNCSNPLKLDKLSYDGC